MRFFRIILAAVLVMMAASASAQPVPGKYSLDKDLTHVGFHVGYFLVLRVTGRFDDFGGAFVIDRAHPENNRANIVIQTASVDTGVESRNRHIRGPGFFNATQYPDMTFTSDNIELGPDNMGEIRGSLTLRGVTKPVTLHLVRIPAANGARSGSGFADGFVVTGKIDRSDFGMTDDVAPVGNIVTLFLCYKAETCGGMDNTRRKNAESRYNQ